MRAGNVERAARWESALPRLPARLAQIDLLKGIAIVGVLLLHSLPVSWLRDGLSVYYIGQAVPVFVILSGLNGTASLWRLGQAGPAQVYSTRYLLSRLDRIYVPFLIIFVASVMLAVSAGRLTAGAVSGPVVGLLPYSGPGNYYVAFAIQFALLFPLYYVAYRRSAWATTVAAFVIGMAFVAVAPHIAAFTRSPYTYVYAASILRFLPFLALGAILGDRMLHGRGVPAWWWAAGSIGVIYLAIVHFNVNAFPLDDRDWRPWGETFLSAFYPALIVAAGLRWLPSAVRGALWGGLASLGVASYEIFLVQILYFGVLGSTAVAMVVPSVVVCCALGYGLHHLLRRASRLTALVT